MSQRVVASLVCLSLAACLATIDRSKIIDDTSPNDASATDAGITPACGDATLCDDFERDDVLGPWANVTEQRGATLGLSTKFAHGGSKSLVITLPATNNPYGRLVSKTQLVASRATLRLFIYLPADSAGRSISGSSIIFTYDAGRTGEIYFSVNGDRLVFIAINSVPGTDDKYTNLSETTVVREKWTEVVIDVFASTTQATMTLGYNGAIIANAIPAPFGMPPAPPIARVGANYAPNGPATAIYVDDVSFDVIP